MGGRPAGRGDMTGRRGRTGGGGGHGGGGPTGRGGDRRTVPGPPRHDLVGRQHLPPVIESAESGFVLGTAGIIRAEVETEEGKVEVDGEEVGTPAAAFRWRNGGPAFAVGGFLSFSGRDAFCDLRSATASFDPSRSLGRGAFAEVFRGLLPDGKSVAVKRLDLPSSSPSFSSSDLPQQALAEIVG